MNALTVWLSSLLVRGWTRLYTWGLPDVARRVRREEIESDLWEMRHEPVGRAGVEIAAQMIARLVLGVPDDLLWRAAHVRRRTMTVFRAAATILLAALVWAYVQWLGPQTLPAPHGRSMEFVSEQPRLPPPPPPPPSPSR